jgi:hypothetical protein
MKLFPERGLAAPLSATTALLYIARSIWKRHNGPRKPLSMRRGSTHPFSQDIGRNSFQRILGSFLSLRGMRRNAQDVVVESAPFGAVIATATFPQMSVHDTVRIYAKSSF